MVNIKKFQNKLLCICQNNVIFQIIPEIECDWGIHNVIQCPKCEELFSIDVECPAFQTIKLLDENNLHLFSNDEIEIYLKNSHFKKFTNN
jgi:hypothetical protein